VPGHDARNTKETRTSRISSLLRLRSEAEEPQEVDVVIPGYINLTAYPDSPDDAKTNPWLHAVMRLAAASVTLPDRTMDVCTECGGMVLNFMAQDATAPTIIFGGSICTNSKCTVLYVCVSEDDEI